MLGCWTNCCRNRRRSPSIPCHQSWKISWHKRCWWRFCRRFSFSTITRQRFGRLCQCWSLVSWCYYPTCWMHVPRRVHISKIKCAQYKIKNKFTLELAKRAVFTWYSHFTEKINFLCWTNVGPFLFSVTWCPEGVLQNYFWSIRYYSRLRKDLK